MRWWLQARIKLRRFFGFMAIIDDLQQRVLECEEEINSLECDKVDESDMWDVQNRLEDIETKLE